MRQRIAWLIAIWAIAGAAADAQAQSFNCRSADFPDEFLICDSPELSRLDERLDRVFRQNMSRLSRAEQRALDREEERWVISRRRCGRNYGCIEVHYEDRIDELTERLRGLRGDAPAPWLDRPLPPAVQRRAPEPAARSREARSVEDRDLDRTRAERLRRTEAAAARAKREPQREEARTSRPRTSVAPPERQGAAPRHTPVLPPADRASGSTTEEPRIEFVDPPLR